MDEEEKPLMMDEKDDGPKDEEEEKDKDQKEEQPNFIERFFLALPMVKDGDSDSDQDEPDEDEIGKIPIQFDFKDKSKVRELDLSLKNVCLVTNQAIKALEVIKEKETIVAMGDTGCGKSTLLTALIYGVNDL